MRAARAFVVAAFGCNFHVTPSKAVDGAVPIDAATGLVSGTLRLDYATNGADLAPTIATKYYAATEATLAVVHGDGTTTPVALDPRSGAFSFVMDDPSQPYRLRVATPQSVQDLELAARELVLVDRVAGRPTRVAPTSYTIDVQLASAVGTAVLYSTGLWTQSAPSVAANSTTYAYNWASASSVSGPLGLLDATRNDALYYTEIGVLGSGAQAYDAITSFGGPFLVTMANGGATTLSGPVNPVTPNACVHLIAQGDVEHHRITAALPRAYAQANADWQIDKTPIAAMSPLATTWLAIAGQQNGTAAPIADLDMQPQYFDGLPGDEVATVGVVEFFSFQLPTALPSPLGAIANASRAFVSVGATTPVTCASNFTVVATTVGLVGTSGTLDSAALPAADNTPVPLDLSRPITATWSLAALGPVDFTTVSVFALTSDQGTTTPHLVGRVDVAGTSAILDPSWFALGGTYALQYATRRGYPNASAGDFSTIAYPYEAGVSWSHSFVVAPPSG
jgi:hypothetical protein